MELSGYNLIGTLAKLHGFKGDYLFITEFSFPKKIEKWETVFIEIDGLPVPFFISSLRITSENSAIIGFEDINSSEQAKEFVGCSVLQLITETGKRNKSLPDETFEGFKVYDKNAGYIGTIDSILEYSQNILFRILNHNQEILVPAIEEYILNVDPKKKELYISVPEGLLDLNE
jgi:16S rRNA processing protein RimM